METLVSFGIARADSTEISRAEIAHAQIVHAQIVHAQIVHAEIVDNDERKKDEGEVTSLGMIKAHFTSHFTGKLHRENFVENFCYYCYP